MDALQAGDPELVGQYRLLYRLGSGGMGRVYLGQSPDGVMVAVKLIRPDLAGNADFRRRFAQEVEAAKRICGPFTSPVVDADPDGAQPWLVTRYVAGPSVADAVASHGPFGITSVRILAAGLAGGLSTVHAAGLVHRDLKPSNVLLAIDGPRIIDFGISRAVDSAWLTSHGRIVGSPGFMSPEQAIGRDVGPAADIFSLGGVLAFAASGRPPFGTGPAPALLSRVVYGSASLGHVPAELRPMIERCLVKDPAARPTTAELLAELGSAPRSADWLSRHAPFFRVQQTAVGSRVALAAGARPARRPSQADHTRPARYPRYAQLSRPLRSKTALAAWSLAVALAAGGTSGAVLASQHSHQQPAKVSADPLPQPRSDQRKHIPVAAPPRAVVLAFFAAINARRWHQAWHLGGINLSASYHAMIAGFAGTIRDEIESVHVTGDHVTVRLRAVQAGGVVRLYRISYVVRDGIIAAGTMLASSVIAAPAGPTLAGPQPAGPVPPKPKPEA